MTAEEERLVLELHAKWGNRWSRIARKLPGRTDNEIKNYWRTHMRKKAQEQKRGLTSSPSTSSPSSSSSTSCSSSNNGAMSDTGEGGSMATTVVQESGEEEATAPAHQDQYTMDQLWNEIAVMESTVVGAGALSYAEHWNSTTMCTSMPSPVWEFCSDSLWRIDDEEYKKMLDAS